jgi:hypothetical protein
MWFHDDDAMLAHLIGRADEPVTVLHHTSHMKLSAPQYVTSRTRELCIAAGFNEGACRLERELLPDFPAARVLEYFWQSAARSPLYVC